VRLRDLPCAFVESLPLVLEIAVRQLLLGGEVAIHEVRAGHVIRIELLGVGARRRRG
jgi:hypothetical protein